MRGVGDWGTFRGTVTLDSLRDSLVCPRAGADGQQAMGHVSTPPLEVTTVLGWNWGRGARPTCPPPHPTPSPTSEGQMSSQWGGGVLIEE